MEKASLVEKLKRPTSHGLFHRSFDVTLPFLSGCPPFNQGIKVFLHPEVYLCMNRRENDAVLDK